MNYIDLILLSIVCLSAYFGWKHGFIFSFIELLNWTGSLAIGFMIYPLLSSLLLKVIDLHSFWTTPLIFLVSIVLARMLLAVILDNILKLVPDSVHQNLTNKLLGTIPGSVNGVIFAALLAILISGVPLGNNFSEEAQNSSMVYKLTSRTKWIEEKARPVFSHMLNESGTVITIHPETNKLIKLPYKVNSSKTRPDLEAQMLVLINHEREERNLKPLSADLQLRDVARNHSIDMFRRGYFSHNTPEGKDPFDRIRKANITFMTAGENLALSPNLKTAHTGLMESPGHKANILHRDFGRVGIGIIDGGSNGIMVTQNFRN
ncbi:MAG TPA: CvpA family protein [Daejeonella sp.]|nr:CvpA family protein [Daejeonella sp.]